MPFSLGRPLRAIFGRFRGASPAPLVDEASRRAELLAKGRLIAAKREAELVSRAQKALEQAHFDEAMGTKASAVKGALEGMGFSGIRVTGKGARRTLSMPAPAISASKFASAQRDFNSLQGAFGLTTQKVRSKGRTRYQISFTSPTVPQAWVPPSQRQTVRINSTIGTTANSTAAAASAANARTTRRIKGRTWSDTAGVWLASQVYRGGRYARQSRYPAVADAGRTMTAAAGWMRRHPRMTAAYAAYTGYAMMAGGDQPFAIG